jgi:pullulanase/glycogen debranching enzyme
MRPFFAALRQDPCWPQVHLIAEPWDMRRRTAISSAVSRAASWSGTTSSATRARYWLRGAARPRRVRAPLHRVSDLFHHGLRAPTASVNFIAAHDGFTLADLVSYRAQAQPRQRRGQPRRARRRASRHNFGIEATATIRPCSPCARACAARCSPRCCCAQGTPMLLAGDEIGNSQQGNNNAYCQDNADTAGWTGARPTGAAAARLACRLHRTLAAGELCAEQWAEGPRARHSSRDLACRRPAKVPMCCCCSTRSPCPAASPCPLKRGAASSTTRPPPPGYGTPSDSA